MSVAQRRTPLGLVIVPSRNEVESLPSLVEELRTHLPDWDILVVDDGSVDATLDYHPDGVHMLRLPFNLGIGGAVQAGYRYALFHGYRLALQVDGDGQHPPQEAGRLLARHREDGAELVIGSRFMVPGHYKQSLFRAAGTALLRAQLYLLTRRRFTDCASGFRLASYRVIRAFAYWYPDDYPEPEVLLHLHRTGCRIAEVPVRMRQRRSGRSSISMVAGLLYVVKVSFSLLLGLGRRPWPDAVLTIDPEGTGR